MKQELPVKGEVIVAGLGGGGVLTSGILLAEAAVNKYKNVTWFPSYAISKRGGFCECSVIFSDSEIASPLLSQAEGMVVADPAQFKDYENRVRPGGTMVVENAGLKVKSKRKDIKIIEIPAIETAIKISGSSRGANIVLLGAFVELTQIISPELVKQQIEKTYAGKEKVQKSNLQAFEEGRSIIRKNYAS